MPKIRVLIADDHGIVRAGLQLLIDNQSDMEVVGQVASVAALLDEAPRFNPDVVTLDVSLPDGSGITAIVPLRALCPTAKILVVTVHSDPPYVQAALAAGAHGYVGKTVIDVELLSAIRAVHHNRTFIDVDRAANPTPGVLATPPSTPAGADGNRLSVREREVLELLAHGHSNQKVADQLFLSVKTVETYRSRIADKLGLRNRADLVRHAIDLGIFRPGAVAPSTYLELARKAQSGAGPGG